MEFGFRIAVAWQHRSSSSTLVFNLHTVLCRVQTRKLSGKQDGSHCTFTQNRCTPVHSCPDIITHTMRQSINSAGVHCRGLGPTPLSSLGIAWASASYAVMWGEKTSVTVPLYTFTITFHGQGSQWGQSINAHST